MKRKVLMATAFLMAVMSVGCGGDNSSTADNSQTTTTTSTALVTEQTTGVSADTAVGTGVVTGGTDTGTGVATGIVTDISGTETATTTSSQTGYGIIDTSKIDFSDVESLDNTKQCFGSGVNVNEDNRPTNPVALQEQYGDIGGLFIGEKSKNIYLTFDEGYENGYTEKILDVLKAKNCSAVFFVTMEYVQSNPELITRMINEGHVVGNHSVHHKSMPELTTQEDIAEIADLHNYVYENFGYSMSLFRPPMGEFSEKTIAIANKLGYKTTLWSFAYKDWITDDQPAISDAYAKVTGSVHDGALYLLHAVSSTNTAILGDVIDNFRSLGYTVGAYR